MRIKNILIYLVLIFCLSGCMSMSLFGGKKGQEIPSKPTRNFEEIEDIRGNVGIIVDISQEAYTGGINAHSYESTVLLKSAKVLQTVSGLPTEMIDYRVIEEVEDLHERILENEKDHRIAQAEWEAEIAALSDEKAALKNQNSKLSSALDTATFWFWFCVIALGVLCFLCPTIGIPLVKFLLGRAKKLGETAVVETASALKSQMGQMVDAIEEFKEKEPEGAKKLLENLQKKTDSHTRKLISELKNK